MMANDAGNHPADDQGRAFSLSRIHIFRAFALPVMSVAVPTELQATRFVPEGDGPTTAKFAQIHPASAADVQNRTVLSRGTKFPMSAPRPICRPDELGDTNSMFFMANR